MLAKVHLLKKPLVCLEMRTRPVLLPHAVPMRALPTRIFEDNFTNQSIYIGAGRYSKPLATRSCFYIISSSPVLLGKLYVIVENEYINVVNDVEVSLPRNIV